jgi:transcriptional regulator with XRE-family HTH domain
MNMNQMGNKIARKRKDLGMTQITLAEELNVTRQTVSRWEAGTVLPDIDKISDIASILGVSCDYLLKDGISEEETVVSSGISRLLKEAQGKTVRLSFFDGEADLDLFNTDCTIIDFEGNWMKVEATTKKGKIEKLIPVSSVLSMVIREED